MKKLLIICGILLTTAASAQSRTESKPYVRWWWLGSAVDTTGLNHNLSEFARKGIGGMEITPIYGVKGNEANDLKYLSPEWMEAYKFTVRRAAELGLQVDLSNCTGWPFGGPRITPAESAQKYILEKRPMKPGERIDGKLLPADVKQQAAARLQAVQAVNTNGRRIDLMPRVDAEGTLAWKAPGTGWTLYTLYAGRTFQRVKRAAPGGEGLVLNHYNKQAVEHYLARFDEAFDESNAPWPDTFFNDSFEVYGASWDETLLAEFERDHGYRLQDYLPEFADEGASDRSARIVCDYRQTLAGMLLRNFTQTWTSWAHARGSRIRNQAHGSPGNIFDLYAEVDIPECESFGSTQFDIPGLRRDTDAKESDADPAVLKFASSAAHVTGKPLTSCETLTWLTEHFHTSLSQCKPEIDQILASGVNHVYFHGAPYSPKGAAFPGWLFYASVNFSPTATLWRDAEGFFSYVTRCQEFLQTGKPDNDYLLYIPMEDISYTRQGRNLLLFDIHKMARTMPGLKQEMNAIVRGGYDADYISDRWIASLTVEGGRIRTAKGGSYEALILPSCRLIPVETLEKVLSLARAGARVIFQDRYPDDVPGFGRLDERRTALKQLTAQLPAANFSNTRTHTFGAGTILTGSDLPELLKLGGGAFEPLKMQGCQLIRRTDDKGARYFISLLGNTSVDGWVTLSCQSAAVEITDPLTGQRGLAATRPAVDGTTQIYLQLRPGESVLLRAFSQAVTDTAAWHYEGPYGEGIEGRDWTLSFPSSEPSVAEKFALDSLKSWTSLSPEAAVLCGTGRYTATFTVADPAAADEWVLDLGDVRESARVRINGQEADLAWAIPFRMEVGRYLRKGGNRIEVDVTNLPANLIADYDRRGVEWRIFKDANVASVTNKAFDTSRWETMPSGLNSPVKLYPVKFNEIR